MKSAGSGGFAAREVAQTAEAQTYSGIQMELVNVTDVTPGVVEIYKSNDPALGGRSLWPHAAGITLASFSSVGAYDNIKSRADNALSLKLSRSYPIYISSFRNRKRMGFLYARVALPGLLFVGEASGCSGIVHGMMSGFYAVQAAGAAVRGTASQTNAADAYAALLKGSDIVKVPFCYRHIGEFYGSYRNWLEKSKGIRVSI